MNQIQVLWGTWFKLHDLMVFMNLEIVKGLQTHPRISEVLNSLRQEEMSDVHKVKAFYTSEFFFKKWALQ